jgi:hypothetical protein
MSFDHPHPDPAHVMRTYRHYILGCKRSGKLNHTARSQTHYRDYLATYLDAKRALFRRRSHENDLLLCDCHVCTPPEQQKP